MNKVELLSPAGDFDSFKIAINSGADAVYIGGSKFSARNFARNFSLDEVKEAVIYAHLRNAKVYVAINTLLDDNELEQAMDLVKSYYEYNVDALIIQDLGLLYRIKNEYPDFELHASTQMHIHNLSGIKNAIQLGFSRVIIPRESSLKEINNYCKEDIDIECFVHGAICASYSGQCLMSYFTKDRSANRGECAQCCRLKYSYIDNDKTIKSSTDYLLSPKDMMLISEIPQLIESGIKSFKIEGRMKSPAYVGYVTSLYRKAIDSYYENKEFSVSDVELNNLKILFNRDYTNEYLYDRNDNIYNNIRPNNMGIVVGKVIDSSNCKTKILLENDLKKNDCIRIISNNSEYGTEIFTLFDENNNSINSSQKGNIVIINTKGSFNKGDIVLKTKDNQLEKEIINNYYIKNPINLHIDVKPNYPLKVKCEINDQIFDFETKIIAKEVINYPISIENIKECFNKVDNHPYIVESFNINYENCFIYLKDLNIIRRDFYDNLDLFILSKFKRNETKPLLSLNSIDTLNILSTNIEINENRYNDYILSPTVNRDSIYQSNNNIVSDFGGLLLKGNKIGFYTLNIYNSFAFELLLRLGFKNVILSVELNKTQTDLLINKFNDRNESSIFPMILVKGYVNLMNIYKDPFDYKYRLITDGKRRFIIDRHNSYTSLCLEIDYFSNSDIANKYYSVSIK